MAYSLPAFKEFSVTVTLRINAHKELEAESIAHHMIGDLTREHCLVRVDHIGHAAPYEAPHRRASDAAHDALVAEKGEALIAQGAY